MVRVKLQGMLSPEFEGQQAPLMRFSGERSAEYTHDNPPVEVRDARKLQAGAASEAAFFAEHGFVLLPHVTKVKDWSRDVASIYRDEISAIIRERLLPGRSVIMQQAPNVIQRGRERRFYAEGVHSDGPLTPKSHASNLGAMMSSEVARAWLNMLQSERFAGFVLINFWRTTNMRGPLQHMPLALCDPNSIERKDMIPNTIDGIAPDRPTQHLALRFNAGQRWYYYPEMTRDEVIAFKLCEFQKDDPDARPQNVFHTAFEDPDAPDDCERRQSCEHRAGVMILRD